jgi:hypothetical protein
MSLQIRRGTAAEVATITPDLGEPIYVTDTESLVIGDGSTAGGINVSGNLQELSIGNITEAGHSVTVLNDANSTGTIRLANLTNAYNLTVGPDGTLVTGPLSVSTTATVANLVTSGNIDGSEGAVANMTGFRAGYYGGTGGYAFKNDTDTGMFGWGASDLRFRVDGENTALVDGTEWSFQNNISVANTATVDQLVVNKILGSGTNSVAGSIQIIPNDTLVGAGQYLNIRPTAAFDGNHIHIEKGNNSADLMLGDDDQYVKLASNGTISVTSFDASTTSSYQFSSAGITFPD